MLSARSWSTSGRTAHGLGFTGGEPEPYPSAEELAADRDLMHRGLEWCARHGITSIQNMDGNLYQLELLAGLEAEGRLICRQNPVPFQELHELDILEKASSMATNLHSEWLSSGMVKVFL